jgi:hypothetical protein
MTEPIVYVTIIPNQVFLDGRDRFEPGQEYLVEIRRATRLERNGWCDKSEVGALVVDVNDEGEEPDVPVKRSSFIRRLIGRG